jgi:hypothetical protein
MAMNSYYFPSIPRLIVALNVAAIPLVSMAQIVTLNSLEGLRLHNVLADVSIHDGRAAVHVTDPGELQGSEETPGMYESYVDLVRGEWTQVKIEISGEQARLYVHGAEQPNLIVNNLNRSEQYRLRDVAKARDTTTFQ